MKIVLQMLIALFLSCQSFAQVKNTFLIDFGKNDGTNGNPTEELDTNGNAWNNFIDTSLGAEISLSDVNNDASGISVEVTKPFLSNGRVNGGLLEPNSELLGDLAIGTGTEDYFYVEGSNVGGLKFKGLDTNFGYVFKIYATRATSSTRISQYDFLGTSTFSGTLQTSGAGSGVDSDGNNNTIFETTPLFPTAEGTMFLDVSIVEGGFAYLGILKLEQVEATVPELNATPVATADDQSLSPGTTTTYLAGSASDADGDELTIEWSQTSGPAVSIENKSDLNTAVSGLEDGNTYTFLLTADDGMLSGTEDIAIFVQAQAQYDTDIEEYFLFDLGKNDGTNGNITNNPDSYGNYWNNIVYQETPPALVNSRNEQSEITVSPKSFESNGIQNGGLLDPEFEFLEELAVPTATQDYFHTQSSATLDFENLDVKKGYVFNVFGSRQNTSTRISQYTFSGSNEVIKTLSSSGVDIGADGYDGNNNVIVSSGVIIPNSEGEISLKLEVVEGGFAYINLIRMDVVEPMTQIFVDFGPNDASNGNATTGRDDYFNYWNNINNPSADGENVNLVDKYNNSTGAYIDVTTGFEMNGINHGGLLSPEESLLGELAVNSVTQDYFHTQSTSSFTLGGLNAESKYVFSVFGTRNTTSTRISKYVFTGSNSFTGNIQTSGTDLGGSGYNGNNSTILVSDTITADAQGNVLFDLSVVEGGFAYIAFLKIEEFKPLVEPEPICTEQNELLIAVMGSSVARGTGATDDKGYAYQYTQILSERSGSGTGLEWEVANISIGGNNTINVLDRWENDLEPLCGSYVIYGLSLGNEGIKGGGQPIFDQWKDNMQLLIEKSREKGIEPIITNCYARNDFTDVEYTFTKDMNILIHQWDVASLNVLGAIEDGSGKWAPGYYSDDLHPNNEGHLEMAYAMVPSLFDALAEGKPQPVKVDDTFITLQKSDGRRFDFSPDGVMHSFTTSFDIKTTSSGVLGGYTLAEGEGMLSLDKNGNLTYVSRNESTIANSTTVLNDNKWHKITLTHYYALGKTLLYVDGLTQGSLNEQLIVSKFYLGGKSAPAEADYREWHVYRAGMTKDEIIAMANGAMLKSSLELYAPLDGNAVVGSDPLVNLAQSTVTVVEVTVEPEEVLSVGKRRIGGFQISPNPVTTSMQVKLTVESENDVVISITDLSGRLVAVIADERMPKGNYTFTWDNPLQDSVLSHRIYLCTVKIGNLIQTKKVILE